jgi:hypothetical protein
MAKKKFIGEDVLFMPSLANDRQKRQDIRNVRRNRRSAIRNAETREEKKEIRRSARQEIRNLRGGETQVSEIFGDVKDFNKQVNQLKANVMSTTLGGIYSLAKAAAGNIASGDVQGLAENAVEAVNFVRSGQNPRAKKKSNNNCA